MTGGKAPRAAGDRFERATVLRLREAGYLVVRSAGSHGVADIVALRGDRLPSLVQCKTTDNTTARQRTAYYKVAADAGAVAVLAFKPNGRGLAFLRVRPNGERVQWEM